MVGTTMKMLLDEVSVYLIKFDGNALAATSRRRRRSRHCSVSAHAQKRRVKKCRFVWQRCCCCCRCCCAAVNALGALFFCIDQKLAVVLPLITCLSLALPLSDFANLIPKWPPRWCRAFDPFCRMQARNTIKSKWRNWQCLQTRQPQSAPHSAIYRIVDSIESLPPRT